MMMAMVKEKVRLLEKSGAAMAAMGRRRIRRRRMLAIFRQLASSDGDLLLTDLLPRPSPQSKCQSFNPGISLSLPGHPAPPPGCWSPGFENKLAGNRGFTCFPDNHRCYWPSLTQLCNIRLCDWRNFRKSSLTQFCSQTLPRVELVIATRESQHMNIMKQLNTDSIPSQFNKFGQYHQYHQVKYSLEENFLKKKTQIWFYLANPTFWVELHGFTGSLPTILLVRDNPEGLI